MAKAREQFFLPGVEIEYRAPEPKPKRPRAPRRKQLSLPGVVPDKKGWIKAVVIKEDGNGVSVTPVGRLPRARMAQELAAMGVPTAAGTLYLINNVAREFRAMLTKSHRNKIDAGERVVVLISPEALRDLLVRATRK